MVESSLLKLRSPLKWMQWLLLPKEFNSLNVRHGSLLHLHPVGPCFIVNNVALESLKALFKVLDKCLRILSDFVLHLKEFKCELSPIHGFHLFCSPNFDHDGD
jgi:hypothetical protein